MKVVKGILRAIFNTVSVIIIILAILILMTVVMTKPGNVPNILGFSMFRVMSGSMEPTLPVDTLIAVRLSQGEDVQKNDVITFYSKDPSLNGSINTHRVIDITEENGVRCFITKGDANQIVDRYPVEPRDMIGVVAFSSVFLGKVVRLVSNPLVFVPLILVPLVLMLATNFIKTIRLSRQMLRDELNAEADAPKQEGAEPEEGAAPEDNAEPETQEPET